MTAIVRFRAPRLPELDEGLDDDVTEPGVRVRAANDSQPAASARRRRLRGGAGTSAPAWGLARACRSVDGLAPLRKAPAVLLPFPRIAIERVGDGLAWRPALRVLVVAGIAAVAAHVAFGGVGLQLRPHKAKAERVTMAVAEQAPEVLPDDVDAPPPPPPPSPSAAAAAPSVPSDAPAAAAPSLAPLPGLDASSFAGSGDGPAMRAGAPTSTSATATAAGAAPPPPRVDAPRVRTRPAPEYPRRAREQRVQGHVTLQLLIDERGAVADVRVIDADPRGVFEDAAVTAARRFTFEPGRVDGKPADAWVRQVVRFTLD